MFNRKASIRQLEFWLTMFQDEVKSHENKAAFKKKVIEELKKCIKQKQKKRQKK